MRSGAVTGGAGHKAQPLLLQASAALRVAGYCQTGTGRAALACKRRRRSENLKLVRRHLASARTFTRAPASVLLSELLTAPGPGPDTPQPVASLQPKAPSTVPAASDPGSRPDAVTVLAASLRFAIRLARTSSHLPAAAQLRPDSMNESPVGRLDNVSGQ